MDAFLEEVDIQLQLLEDNLEGYANNWKQGEREKLVRRCADLQREAWEKSQDVMEKALQKKLTEEVSHGK